MKNNNKKIKNIIKQVMIFNDFYEEVIQSSLIKNQNQAVSKLEFRLLHTVYRHKKLMISEIADLLNISLPNCSRYVKTAIEDGYIKKQIDSDDKRVYYVTLTDKGVNIVESTLSGFTDEMSQQFNGLDLTSLDRLNQSFCDLNSAIQDTIKPTHSKRH
ncbi:MarR family winged helix-turn-helix transcriptional regulator [Fusibacter tunisiensis]|uniref:DNA-binding MarR family transcriptional regulator n=1 Tax=Fusibacter tunisiensis TaxID=1008308 RepID=A0ABS2MRH6_9FIRM|nr:MarR family transcriptional regulator [Fusibacter tunisiensis]MBM7562011.1 DNA-binding MarR family transcriptional regulator [Fusibacter tunisiensis]